MPSTRHPLRTYLPRREHRGEVTATVTVEVFTTPGGRVTETVIDWSTLRTRVAESLPGTDVEWMRPVKVELTAAERREIERAGDVVGEMVSLPEFSDAA